MKLHVFLPSALLAILALLKSANGDASTELENVIELFYSWKLNEYPEYSGRVGIFDSMDRITDLTEATFIRQKDEAETMLLEAQSLSMIGLDVQERVSLKVIVHQLRAFVDGFDYRKYSIYNMLSPLSSPTSYFRGLFSSCCIRTDTKEDYDALLIRLSLLETYVDQRITLMREAISLNFTAHDTSLTGIIDKIDEEIVVNPSDSYYYQTLFDRQRPSAIDQNTWQQLDEAGLNITENIVIPSWITFKRFLEQEYMPKTRPQEGVGSLSGGYEYYAQCLKWHIGVDLTPEEVHQIGLDEVARISKLMENEMKADGFTGTLQDYIEKVRSDPLNSYTSEEDMLAAYQQIIDDIKPKISQVVKNGPTSGCQVQRNTNPQSSMGSYSSPSPTRPYGVFWANVFEPETKTKSYMIALTLHETEPGHHTQLGYADEKLGHLPMFRQSLHSIGSVAVPFDWPTFTAHTEGWALYAESLGELIGAYTWKYSLFERYGSEIFRAVRLVVDTGMHAKGWSKQKAMEYKANYTTRSATTIENDINRYISWPGQACAYKIGQMKIEELRDKASNELGGLFDLAEFNEQIFKYGRIPLNILDEVIDEWILEKKELQDPSIYVKTLYDEYMEWRIKENPELGTRIGRHDRDDQITDLTEDAFIRQRNVAEQFLEKANAVAVDTMSKKEKIELKVFRSMLQTFVDGFPFRKHSIYNMLSPLWDTPTSQWNGVFSGLQYRNVDDYRSKAFERLKLLEQYVNQRMALMNEAIRLNITSHTTVLTGIVEKIDQEEIVENPRDSPVFTRFFNRNKPTNISVVEWGDLQNECEDLINTTYLPSWIKFRNFLDGTYRQNLRKEEGVGSLTNGLAYYESCLKWHLSVDMRAEEVHQIGLSEVDRISKLMENIMRADNFTGNLKGYLDYLKNLPSNFYSTVDEMMEGYQAIVAKVHPTLQMAFNNIADVECRVEGDPDPQGVIASYSGPSSGRPYGVFNVNIYEPEKKPISDMMSLSLHEAEPGHHTHYAYTYEKLRDRSQFRTSTYYNGRTAAPFTWPIFSSYTEGWGLYGESLGELLGVYEGDLHSLFGRYAWEIFRAIRLVVDTGMHAKGWTKQEAMDYIAEYTTFTESTNENEVNRYISWPGQACAYKIGQIKIEELRNRAITELGEAFDIREFHDQVLQLGTVPLKVLEEFIDEWIKDTKLSWEKENVIEKLFDEFFEWRVMDNPEYGTNVGIHQYDDKISHWTEEAFLASLERAILFLSRVQSIDQDGLKDQTIIHLDILEQHLNYFIAGFPFRKYGAYNGLSPLSPPTGQWSSLMARMKYNTLEDYNKAFTRLSLLDQYVDERITLMTESIQNGITLHNTSLDQIPEKMGDEIVQYANQSSYFKTMFDRDIPVGISQTQWLDLQAEASVIIMNSVVPAWGRFKTFLENEYYEAVRPWEGVWSLEGGKEFYQRCLNHFTSTTFTPEEIHELGLQEVNRISQKMEEIMTANSFTGTLQDYIAFLRDDPTNFYETMEEMITGFEEIIEETHHKLDRVLLKIPESVVEVKAATNEQASGGSYSQPPLDGSRNGTFTANVFNPENKPKFTMVSLTLHEAEPGHHTQLSYSIENDIPLWRRAIEYANTASVPFTFPSYSGFTEGWALYSETLGLEMDAFDETKWPHSIFGMYVSEMFRAVRLVVDTGIHAFGWSKQRAIDYALNYTTYAPERVENEINRYISWPGQACSYKLGQLQIQHLRMEAESALGEVFDIREFNDEVLQVGASPLTILETRIRNWIADKKPEPQTPSTSHTTPTTTTKMPASASPPFTSSWLGVIIPLVALLNMLLWG